MSIASTAPPMRSDHVEIRRRRFERATKALSDARDEFNAARADIADLVGDDKTDWAVDEPALRAAARDVAEAMDTHARAGRIQANLPRLDFADTPLQKQVGGAHYKKMKIQVVEFVDKNQIPYLEGNAIKYICRHAEKGGVQDIDKAIHYLQLLKELRYGTAE